MFAFGLELGDWDRLRNFTYVDLCCYGELAGTASKKKDLSPHGPTVGHRPLKTETSAANLFGPGNPRPRCSWEEKKTTPLLHFPFATRYNQNPTLNFFWARIKTVPVVAEIHCKAKTSKQLQELLSLWRERNDSP